MRRWRMWTGVALVVGIVVAVLLLMRGCEPEDVSVIAVGDMACSPLDPDFGDGEGVGDACRAQALSDQALTVGADALLGLGDYQHELPTSADYETAYGPTWGRLKEITYPTVGNQELKVHKANTFYDYFGKRAGPRSGYYSYDLGAWHLVVLNTNCSTVEGGCGPESPQAQWLRDDLARTSNRCVLAYAHHPRWSNGIAGPNPLIGTLFDILAENRAALYLSGHEADYERFPPMDGNGRPDPTGTVQMVVGTGGQSVYTPTLGDAPWRATADPVPNAFMNTTQHGYLVLDLMGDGYSWRYEALGGEILDSGSALCPERP